MTKSSEISQDQPADTIKIYLCLRQGNPTANYFRIFFHKNLRFRDFVMLLLHRQLLFIQSNVDFECLIVRSLYQLLPLYYYNYDNN